MVDLERFCIFMKEISYQSEFEPVWIHSCLGPAPEISDNGASFFFEAVSWNKDLYG